MRLFCAFRIDMERRISLLSRIVDFLQPRFCVICGSRLAVSEEVVCCKCNMLLPRTNQCSSALDNDMARLFWGRLHVAQCASFMHYQSHTPASRLFYQLKYHNQPEVGVVLGRMAASEYDAYGFFEGVDMIIPLPLSRKRERQRGYNQCLAIAYGIAQVKNIPIRTDVVKRVKNTETQTHKNPIERLENVQDAFLLQKPEVVKGKHVLLVDDVVTTGASLVACGRELEKAGGVVVSIFTLGQTEL